MNEPTPDAPGLPELLPCPFCGSDATLWNATSPEDGFVFGTTIECQTCTVAVKDEYQHEAIKHWNTRAALSARPLPSDWVADGFVLIDKGAVKLVENVLRRAQKGEVADAMLSAIGQAMMEAAPSAPAEEVDALCPNCLTPWKCNGPHLTAPEPLAQGIPQSAVEAFSRAVEALRTADPKIHAQSYLALEAGISAALAEIGSAYASPQPAAEVPFDRERIVREATLRAVCYSLKKLIEGPGSDRWTNGYGLRLKDTKQWVEFCNTVTAISQFRTPDPITEEPNPPHPSASVGERARELLAAEYRAHSFARLNAIGDRIADPNSALTADEGCALRAIESALTTAAGGGGE